MIRLRKPCDQEHVSKGWGVEVIIVNNDEYCGKFLKFKAGSRFSLHFHIKKLETFYVLSGNLYLYYIDLTKGTEHSMELFPGDAIDIPRFEPHRIIAKEESTIIEFSTHHEDSDSYRIAKGDSQK